ncbi:MAG: hypothetical protein IKG76_10050 [Firmicutes bacterium]|nr:hypothetical protein [Bacillota bacterium]
MIGEMPDYMESKYYKPREEGTYGGRITADAPDKLKAEFEAHMNDAPTFLYGLKNAFPDIKEPYYTWDGRVIEKSSKK